VKVSLCVFVVVMVVGGWGSFLPHFAVDATVTSNAGDNRGRRLILKSLDLSPPPRGGQGVGWRREGVQGVWRIGAGPKGGGGV